MNQSQMLRLVQMRSTVQMNNSSREQTKKVQREKRRQHPQEHYSNDCWRWASSHYEVRDDLAKPEDEKGLVNLERGNVLSKRRERGP